MGWNAAAVGARIGAAIALGLAGVAAPLSAQDASAPRVANPLGELVDRAILVEGYGSWDRGEAAPLRTAQPLVDPVLWFGAASALAEAHRADPLASRYTTILLDITADGAIAGCRYAPSARPIIDEAVLCGEIAGQRFLPQLADDGSRVSGEFRLSLSSRNLTAEPGAPPRPLFTGERDTRPAPMPPPRVEQITGFPPDRFEVSYLYRAPQWTTAPRPGWGDTPQEGPMTGLILYRSRTPEGTACRVLAPSGDPARDAAGCTYGKQQLVPDWSAVEGRQDWMVPLAILHRPDSMIAIGPDPDRIRQTQLAEGADAALVAALTRAGVLPEGREKSPLVLNLAATPEGAVRHCRVVRTTGNDAQDIAACAIARETVRLMPMEDVFGTPNPLASMFWRADTRTE